MFCKISIWILISHIDVNILIISWLWGVLLPGVPCFSRSGYHKLWTWRKLVVTPRPKTLQKYLITHGSQHFVGIFVHCTWVNLPTKLLFSFLPAFKKLFFVNPRYPRGSFLCGRQIFECEGAPNAMTSPLAWHSWVDVFPLPRLGYVSFVEGID